MASEANVTEINNMANGNASTIGGMPSQITHGMKRRLRDLGHTKAEIYEMTPGEAWALLNRSPSDCYSACNFDPLKGVIGVQN